MDGLPESEAIDTATDRQAGVAQHRSYSITYVPRRQRQGTNQVHKYTAFERRITNVSKWTNIKGTLETRPKLTK